MIRILHTADWHIGQTLRGYSREHEHRIVLRQLERIVAEREVDALIVAGDVFDSQNPSGEAQTLFYETLVRLSRARPEMTIVVTAGNHDAAGRLEAPKPLLAAFNVHVVGSVRRSGTGIDATRHLVQLKTSRGELAGHVLAVSYPTAACLPNLGRSDGVGGSPIISGVRDLYAELVYALAPRISGLPLIATGHLHVSGGVESEGSERRILVGGEHAVPHDVFPEDAAYVALGHLHRAQSIGRETVRYSGSLIPLSVTEQPYEHGVTMVTIDGGTAMHEHIPVQRPVPFIRLPDDGDVRLDDLGDHLKALGLPSDLTNHDRPFVHVRLAREGLSVGFREEVDRIAEAFPVRIVDIRVAPLPGTAGDRAPAADALIRLVEKDPEDLFRLVFERRFGVAPSPAHLEVFHQARAEASL